MDYQEEAWSWLWTWVGWSMGGRGGPVFVVDRPSGGGSVESGWLAVRIPDS